MANSLKLELDGMVVVLKNKMLFKVGQDGGFGASPITHGQALFGTFRDGSRARVSGYDVKRLATADEVRQFMARRAISAKGE